MLEQKEIDHGSICLWSVRYGCDRNEMCKVRWGTSTRSHHNRWRKNRCCGQVSGWLWKDQIANVLWRRHEL